MNECKYCKGTGKVLMLFNYVDCECLDKEETVINENLFVVASDIAKIVINNGRVIYFDSNGAKIGVV